MSDSNHQQQTQLGMFTTPEEPGDNASTQHGGPLVAADAIDDEHVRALVQELDDDEIRELVSSMLDETNLIHAVAEATDRDELANNIDAVTDHYAERPSLVEAAGDAIEEALGMRPFDLTITEPDNEYQKPMVYFDVEDDVVLTNDPDINAELVEHATRMTGETESGQRKLFNEWRDAIGGQRVADFKRDRHPDALGFAIPGQIPATGENEDRTPITEIPDIGEATAEDIHPSGDLMSIEDYLSLTDKQHAWVEMPVDSRDFDNRRVRGIARGIVELVPDRAGEALGRALNMMDRRETDDSMEWVNPARTCGITHDESTVEPANLSTVTSAESIEDEDETHVTSEDGSEAKYADEFWKLLDTVADAADSAVATTSDNAAAVALPDGNYLIAAPIESTDGTQTE